MTALSLRRQAALFQGHALGEGLQGFHERLFVQWYKIVTEANYVSAADAETRRHTHATQ
jgi:hypothetical protein